MTSDPLSNFLPALAVNSAFVDSTETRNESPPPWKADASCPVENITRDANVLPYPCCGSHGHNMPNGIPRSDAAAYECARIAQKYDEGACKDWKEEIDTLLVFAGLFSAVTTAFLIDSYKWLLNNTAGTDSNTAFLPTRVEKRINVYWFLSLLLALSSASTGMLCKQWLREYIRDAGRSSKDALCVRQMRLEGLSAWKVEGIISTIPLLLQVALVLFFIGMLELLWPLEKAVAIPFTVIAALVIVFILFTTLAPSIQYCSVILRRSLATLPPQCPYKSPQSWLIVSLFNRVFRGIASVRRDIFDRRSSFSRTDLLGPKLAKHISSWTKYDLSWIKDNADTDESVITGSAVEHYLGRSIAWLMRHFDSPNLQTSLYHLFWNSIQNYDQWTQVFLAPAKNHIPEFFRDRKIVKGSNLDLIVSLAEERSDALLFEAMEQLEDRFRVSSLAPKVLIPAYSEWSACSWDTRYKSRCNADFTATALLYLSGQSGFIGLQHCVRLIKEHLTHPDVNNYNFFIPPGVHAPFNAHISVVTSDTHYSQVSDSGLEENLCDCAKLLLSKRSFHVTPRLPDDPADSRRQLEDGMDVPSSDEWSDQLNRPLDSGSIVKALSMLKRFKLYIPSLPSRTLPYLPQILRFLLKRASMLQVRSLYVGTFVGEMDKYLRDVLHPSRPGMSAMERRDHIRAFINLAIQELHEPLTTKSANAHHLDLHSYPEIPAFIQRLRNLAALLNVPEDRAQWQDILKRCGLEDLPSDSVLLGEVASIPLPSEDLQTNEDVSSLAAQLSLHGVKIPHYLLNQFQQLERRLNAAVEDMASEESRSGSRRGLNRSLLRVLRRRNRGNDVENGTGVDSIDLEAIPNASLAPVDQSGQ